MRKIFFIAEVGINHNGDMIIAKKLIDIASQVGCDAVKFQKRTIGKVYSQEFLDSPRQSPWGTTQRHQKEGLEFNGEQYSEIDEYCRKKGISWFASAWDVDAQKFLQKFNLKYNKVASAMLGNLPLLNVIASEKKYTFISTGMSTYQELDQVVALFKQHQCPFELMHCNSTYPMAPEDANLLLIPQLREKYNCHVGFSSHETGTLATLAALVLGATSIERHITLDTTMYGSDQKASLDPDNLFKLMKDIHTIEKALGTGEKVLDEKEKAIRKKLRG